MTISCSDNDTHIINNGGGLGDGNSTYRIEVEPTLSYDRTKLLVVQADSIITHFNGIYSADINNPIRVAEYLSDGLSSPTRSGQSQFFAYLQNYEMFFYDQTNDTAYKAPTDRYFQKIFFVNDSLLISVFSSYLLLMNKSSVNTITILTEGSLPVAYSVDTVAFLKSIDQNFFSINLLPIPQLENGIDSVVIPIDTIYKSNIKSFGIEPQFKKYCYSVWDGTKFSIYVGGGNAFEDRDHVVATSSYPGVVMLDYNTILYTGEDGRLYLTDFLGENSYPFWALEDIQN